MSDEGVVMFNQATLQRALFLLCRMLIASDRHRLPTIMPAVWVGPDASVEIRWTWDGVDCVINVSADATTRPTLTGRAGGSTVDATLSTEAWNEWVMAFLKAGQKSEPARPPDEQAPGEGTPDA